MRFQLNRDVAFLAAIGVVVAAAFVGSNLLLSRIRSNAQSFSQSTVISPGDIIAHENALAGTNSWIIPTGHGASTQIQAYASATSEQPGQPLKFYVSTQQEGTASAMGIYRLSWYGGLGGRLILLLSNQVGPAQGYDDRSKGPLVGCSLCHIDAATNLIEDNWQASHTLTVLSDWVTGVCLAKFVDTAGMQTYVPFDVRCKNSSTYTIVTSDTTAAAYNTWGEFSLYEEETVGNSTKNPETSYLHRTAKVTFDLPYAEAYDSGYVLELEAEADAVHWQKRFEPDSAGTPDRTIVCYKVATEGDPADCLAHDPFYGKDNTRVTAQWRDPVLHRPENARIGIMYSSYTTLGNYPWHLNPLGKSPLLNGTGLLPGHDHGSDLVDYEWDRALGNGTRPQGLQVLGSTHTANIYKQPEISNTAYYIAPSGAMVFAAGSVARTGAQDSNAFYGNGG